MKTVKYFQTIKDIENDPEHPFKMLLERYENVKDISVTINTDTQSLLNVSINFFEYPKTIFYNDED